MLDRKQQTIKEFEGMLNQSKLKALSKESLNRPLTDTEFKEYKQLMGEEYGNSTNT